VPEGIAQGFPRVELANLGEIDSPFAQRHPGQPIKVGIHDAIATKQRRGPLRQLPRARKPG